jgi:hypothetical protein
LLGGEDRRRVYGGADIWNRRLIGRAPRDRVDAARCSLAARRLRLAAMASLLPLLIFPFLGLIGVGIYRAHRYGQGNQKYLGVIPGMCLIASFFVLPMMIEVSPSGEGKMSPALTVAILSALTLALLSGIALLVRFRPRAA